MRAEFFNSFRPGAGHSSPILNDPAVQTGFLKPGEREQARIGFDVTFDMHH